MFFSPKLDFPAVFGTEFPRVVTTKTDTLYSFESTVQPICNFSFLGMLDMISHLDVFMVSLNLYEPRSSLANLKLSSISPC